MMPVFLGFVIGLCSMVFIMLIDERGNIAECARKNNVFTCEKIYIPTKDEQK